MDLWGKYYYISVRAEIVLALAVVGQWLARLLDPSLDRSFITFSLALILLSVLLYYGLYCWFYLIAYKKILSLGEQNPSGAAVCFLDLRFISAPVPQWVLSDLNFAVFMMRSGYYRESALFAGELWRRFGKNQKQGRQYLQYQYVQFCSFHYMGKEEQAARYLEGIQDEIERNPRDKYSRKITARLEEIRETEGLSGFGSGLPSEGSPASQKEVKEP